MDNNTDKALKGEVAASASGQPNLASLPNELIGEIASWLDLHDVGKMRLANHDIRKGAEHAWVKLAADGRTLYPRYTCLTNFISFLDNYECAARYVRNMILVGEAPKASRYGYDWSWELLVNQECVSFTDHDACVMDEINVAHEQDLAWHGPFIHGGGYRTMLTLILGRLPELTTITLRNLFPGENVPGWVDVEKFKELSFYHKDLETNKIYYGDWQYDTLHGCISIHEDVYGETYEDPPGAGPQATFLDDVEGAIQWSFSKAVIKRL